MSTASTLVGKNPRSMGGVSTRRESEREFWYANIFVLKPHPLNTKLYGHEKLDTALLESIRANGVMTPLTVVYAQLEGDDKYYNYVVSGHRRLAAAKQIVQEDKIKERSAVVAVRRVRYTALEIEKAIIEANRQRIKTAEVKAREFKELKRIEAALAKERKLAGLKKGEKAPVGTESASTGKAATKAAEAVGLGRDTAAKLEKLVDAADAGDPKAKAALEEIDAKKGRGVDAAFKNVFVPEPVSPPAPIVNAWDILVKDDRPERSGQVGKLVALFKDSDLRGALGTSAIGDPVPDTMNRFNLTVFADAATLKQIRNIVGNAPAVKFMGLTARQVELIADGCSVKADKEKAS
jgi:hypothetical protein